MLRRNSLILGAAVAALAAAGTAQARSDVDVQWSVTIGSPAVFHAPRVVVPAPVVVSAPVVVRAPVVVPVEPRYGHGRGHGYAYGHGHEYQRVAYQVPSRWDVDGDGIPNRYDRVYNPRWDVDGDGIPNRHDRAPRVPGAHGGYRGH